MKLLQALIAGVIAVLSGMGVGGGGLFVVYLALFTQTPQLMAQGMNLLFFLFSAGASMLIHLPKRQIFLLAVAVMAGAGVVGSLIGTFLSGIIDPSLLRKIFGGMLAVSGILSLQKTSKPTRAPEKKNL